VRYNYQSRGFGGAIDAAKSRADGIKDGAKEVLSIAKEAKETGDTVGDIGEAILKFFQFGAADIKAPSVGYNPKLSPVQVNVFNVKAFLLAVSQGYVFGDEDWAFFGLKPPSGTGAPGQIWNGVTGRWEGAGKQPKDTTTPYPSTPAIKVAQTWVNGTFGPIGVAYWSKSIGYVTAQIAAGNFKGANEAIGQFAGLMSLIRIVGSGSARLATVMGMTVSGGANVGKTFGSLNAVRIAQLAKIITAMPESQRPSNAGALAALASSSDLPSTTGGATSSTDGGGGGGMLLAIAAALAYMRLG